MIDFRDLNQVTEWLYSWLKSSVNGLYRSIVLHPDTITVLGVKSRLITLDGFVRVYTYCSQVEKGIGVYINTAPNVCKLTAINFSNKWYLTSDNLNTIKDYISTELRAIELLVRLSEDLKIDGLDFNQIVEINYESSKEPCFINSEYIHSVAGRIRQSLLENELVNYVGLPDAYFYNELQLIKIYINGANHVNILFTPMGNTYAVVVTDIHDDIVGYFSSYENGSALIRDLDKCIPRLYKEV